MSLPFIVGARRDLRAMKAVVADLQAAQRSWAVISVERRLKRIRQFRHKVSECAAALLEVASDGPSKAEVIVSEILPLCDAARFLEKEAERVLAPKRLTESLRPFWLSGVEGMETRDPLGVVLIVGASNYPLFLVGVQMLQALAAGNAVLIKPGLGTSAALRELVALVDASGMRGMVRLLDESPENVEQALAAGVAKVFPTGGREAGEAVMHLAAASCTPGVMELSGCDACIVLPSASVETAASAVRFGLTLNRGRSCIRPARLLVHQDIAERFKFALRRELEFHLRPADFAERMNMEPLIFAALDRGGEMIAGGNGLVPAVVSSNETTAAEIPESPAMLPLATLSVVPNGERAAEIVNRSSYRLAASIFGNECDCRGLAARLDVGTVVINDAIVPTSDPRMSFAGRGSSGFGATRGREGLLEMTQLKTVMTRRGAMRHLERAHPADEQMFLGALQTMHGEGWRRKTNGLWQAIKAAAKRREA